MCTTPNAMAWSSSTPIGVLPSRPGGVVAAVAARCGLQGEDLVPAFSRVLARDPGWVAHLAWRRRVGLAEGIGEVVDLLAALSGRIVLGATLDESLEFIYDEFKDVLPYDRIGFAEIDLTTQTARARWLKSRMRMRLGPGYSGPLAGSSLSIVLEQRLPRILNDLPAYLQRHPTSHSTELLLSEGMKSSMTCPLFLGGKPYAFLFFSSATVESFQEYHVKIMLAIGNQLALLLMASQVDHHSDDAGSSGHHEPVGRVALRDFRSGPQVDAERGVATDAAPALFKRPLSELKPGMVVGAPVVMDNGRLLVAVGVQLRLRPEWRGTERPQTAISWVGIAFVWSLLGAACFAMFIGFEATAIYGEESKDPKRTVPLATYIAISTISILFAIVSFAMVTAMGASGIIDEVVARSMDADGNVLANPVTELLVALTPSALSELRDRGLLAYHLNDVTGALRDLQTYLKLSSMSEMDKEAREEHDPKAVFAVNIDQNVKMGLVEGNNDAVVTIVEAFDFA